MRTVAVESIQKNSKSADGRWVLKKGPLVRREKIKASCVNALVINQHVCNVAGSFLKRKKIIKSKGELTSPKIKVTRLISFMS